MLAVEQEAIIKPVIVIATNFRAQFLLQHGVSAGNLRFPIPGRSIVSMDESMNSVVWRSRPFTSFSWGRGGGRERAQTKKKAVKPGVGYA